MPYTAAMWGALLAVSNERQRWQYFIKILLEQ
jgi:hypothetical protein